MELKPVKAYTEPGYPSRGDGRGSYELLSGHIPAAWKENILIAGALLAFSTLTATGALAAEQKGLVDLAVPPAHASDACDNNPLSRSFLELLASSEMKALVAPVFVHGGGTGSSGGMAAHPLHSLTEEEARVIIESEFRKAGVSFDRHGETVKGASPEGSPSTPLVADGYDSRHNLAYDYVPSKVYEKITYHNQGTMTSVNYQKLADAVRKGFEKGGTMSAGVFYDPLPAGCKKADAEMLLRQQVQDFITWAREHKIIK